MAAKNDSDWGNEDEVLDFEAEELADTLSEPEPPAADNLAAMLAKFLEQGGLAKAVQTAVEKQVAQVLASGKTNKAELEVSDNVRGDGGSTGVAQGGSAHGDVTPRSGGSHGGARVEATSSTGAYRSRSGAGCAGGHPRPEARAGGEILEPFDPDDKDCNVDRWLSKIDQLGRIHGWSDYEKSYFMQAKLRGAARRWFNRLEKYDLSWREWKARLQSAFPRRYDSAELLKELVARRKLPSESMTRYYHEKLALCGRSM